MKTAKALGLDVPTSILLSADESIDRDTATQEDWIADGGNGSMNVVSTISVHVRLPSKLRREADIPGSAGSCRHKRP